MATWTVQVRLSDGTKVGVDVPRDASVRAVKEAVGAALTPPAAADGLAVAFKGRILPDADVLAECGENHPSDRRWRTKGGGPAARRPRVGGVPPPRRVPRPPYPAAT
jgi:hypothetical protein